MSKTNRKYIQLYHDSLLILDKLSNEQAGILVKAIYQYSLTNVKPDLDFALDIAITPFINQIEREQERNLQNAEIYRENGKKGGRPKNNLNNQSGFLITKANQNNQLKPITTTITTTNTNTITTNNTNTTNNSEKLKKQSTFDFNDFAENEVEAINIWLDYRKTLKKAYKTQQGLTGLRNKLLAIRKEHGSSGLLEAITLSMSKEWQDVYYVEAQGKKKSNTHDQLFRSNSNDYSSSEGF